MPEADRLVARRSRLSPVKRALLEKRLLQASDPAPSSGVIRERPDPDLVPLSFAQERLWFLDQLEPGNPAYNRPVAFRLTGPLDVSVLERSLSEIMRRHQVLRARFSHVGGRAVQAIGPEEPVSLAVVDLTTYDRAVREARARQLAGEEARRSLDLREGPLVRGTLLQLGGEEHVLVLVIHHIAFDRWSAEVLKGELGELYEAYSSGGPSPLPELSIQYSDFAQWQREHLRGEVLEAQLEYWREKLADCAPLDLPTDRPRPAMRTHQRADQRATLSASLLESLRRLSGAEDVTLYMTLLAAFKVLLHRYTGQDDIVVGSPVAGRTSVDTEGLIGLFVNTLVLRTDVSGDPTFRELLGRVRDTALGAYGQQDVPFEKLVEELGPGRDLSRTPLFQVMFNLENVPEAEAARTGLGMEEFEFDSGVSQFDLAFELQEQDGGLRCCLGYDTDLFDAGTISRMLGHCETLLESIIADPDQRVSRLPLLTAAESQQMLVAWNDTTTEYPDELCIHELFEAQVERTPDTVAVVFGNQQMTYRELNAEANRLAHHLRRRGVGPDVLVGILMERCLEMVVGILGVLKAGGAYVPMDPGHPQARVDLMLRDTQAGVLLTQERFLSGLPPYAGDVLCMDLERRPFAQENEANPLAISGPENLAYVIYTSGSSGKPKGVLLAHRGAVNYFTFFEMAYRVGETDVVLQLPSVSFDASVRDILGPLVVGATTVYVTNAEASSPADLVSKIRQRKVTALVSLVPSMLRAILDVILARHWRCDSLRLMLVGGESLLWADSKKARLALGETARLVNHYGPTECTMTLSYYPIPGPASDQGIVPIGRPISNVQMYLLDEQLNPVPIGVTGEVFVGGVGLARGYLNEPAQTAEAFLPHPFSHESGARIYRTGDLARYSPDGTVEFIGRRDHQVKVRGFRIELGEIEAVLGQHPGVQSATVLARGDVPSGRCLVAYIVPGQKLIPGSGSLRSFLKERLPEHMQPSLVVVLDKMPLTPSGKVDRRALPAPSTARPELGEGYEPPRNSVEDRLVRIWSEVLQVEPIGIHDSFFELGGHSLLAIQVISRICDAFQKEVSLRSVFDAPTIARLSAVIEVAEESSPSSELTRSKSVSRARHSTKASSDSMRARIKEGS